MESIFLKILNMSISASWLILVILLLRLIFRRLPKWIMVLLWGIVALRLLLPVSLESNLSLIPNTETIWVTEDGSDTVVQTGIDPLDRVVAPESWQITHSEQSVDIQEPDKVLTDAGHSEVQVTEQHSSRQVFYILGVIWAVGILALLLYAIISYLRIRRKVKESIPFDSAKDWNASRIRICDRISTPFILGVFRPVIYLPSGLSEEDTELVIAHEMAHLRRRDHLWKPLGFIFLMVYWFNPLVWAAYILLCRDIEMACDEKVIASLEEADKKAYANALVTCATKQREITVCPLAFGEVGVKERVKGILNYKRPAFWVLILSVVACVVIAVCFLTNPAKESKEESSEEKTTANYEGIYYYSGNKKETYGSAVRLIDLAVQIKDDGSFLINELPDGGITSSGKHAVDGDMITLTGTVKIGEEEEKPVTYHFRLDGDKLIYVARDSSDFNVAQVRDGETFLKDKNPYDDYEERCYYYTRNGEVGNAGMIWSWIDLMPDGGCMWMDSYISSSTPDSTYKVEGDVLTITAKSQGSDGEVTELYHFRMKGDSLFFIAEGTSNFGLLKLKDGDEYVLGPDFATRESRKLEEEAWAKLEEERKRRTEEAEAQKRRAEEASKQNKEGKDNNKEYQMVKIISEEIQNDEIIKREYMVSSANAVRLMKTLNPEGRSYSEDVIKSEFEKSYTIVIDDIPTYSLNRDVENGTDSVYMFDLRSTPISGTYISSDIVKLIDEIIEGEISLQKEKAKDNTPIDGLMTGDIYDPMVYDQEIPEFGIRMEVKKPDTKGCDLKFIYTENEQTGPIEFIVGEGYYFQKWEGDHWGRLLTNYSYGVVDIGYGVPTTIQVRWNELFGEQSPGKYRIIAPVVSNRRLGSYKAFYISCTFEIE